MTHERSTDSDRAVQPLDTPFKYESHWNRESGATPVTAATAAVAELEGCDSLHLPPLYEAIDPDALNGSFPPNLDLSADRLVFEYCEYEITVTDSLIRLR